MPTIKVGDIIQVTNKKHRLYKCLLEVCEITEHSLCCSIYEVSQDKSYPILWDIEIKPSDCEKYGTVIIPKHSKDTNHNIIYDVEDIVLISDPSHQEYGCLMIINEIKDDFLKGRMNNITGSIIITANITQVKKVGTMPKEPNNKNLHNGYGRPLDADDIKNQKLCKEVDNLIKNKYHYSKYGTPPPKNEIGPDERTIEDLRNEIYIIKKGLSETEKNSNNDPTTKGFELGMNFKIIELQKELLKFAETQKSFNKTITDCWCDNKKKIQQLHNQKETVHRRLNKFQEELDDNKEKLGKMQKRVKLIMDLLYLMQ